MNPSLKELPQPIEVIRPTEVGALAEIIRTAGSQGQGLYPVGGATKMCMGAHATKPGVAVDTKGLNQVIDYPARDMTVTVQAGISISNLQLLLAQENQYLPVDCPSPEQSTLGGALATNVSGPRRFGRGTLRDFVIGVSFLTDAGIEVKAGGRVVKNVAGYDLCKMQIGALGTLGIISQVTLKVHPTPERNGTVRFTVSTGDLSPILDRIHGSATRPVSVDVTGPEQAGRWSLAIGFSDNASAVDWQIRKLREELLPASGIEDLQEDGTRLYWQELANAPYDPRNTVSVKVSLPSSRVGAFLGSAARLEGWTWNAQAGNGIVYGYSDRDDAVEMLPAWLAGLESDSSCQSVVLRCPALWKAKLPLWGRRRGDLAMMQALKQALDPMNLFNPGRYLV